MHFSYLSYSIRGNEHMLFAFTEATQLDVKAELPVRKIFTAALLCERRPEQDLPEISTEASNTDVLWQSLPGSLSGKVMINI